MKDGPCPLKEEFVADHRLLTKGLAGLITSVEQNDWTAAASEAERLNREAGPHLAFEEEVLYPYVAERRGQESVQPLYDEHHVFVDAIRRLMNHPDGNGVSPEERQDVLEGLRTGLDHAVACGTLLSYITVLDNAEQRRFLKRLRRFRRDGKSLLQCEEMDGPQT